MSNRKKRKKRKRHIVILIIVAIAFVAGFQAFLSYAERGERTKVTFTNPDGSTTPALHLKVAQSEAERAKGLMFVKKGELAENEGMLFIFDKETNQTFWMRNTYISLDMIFIGRDLEVKGLVENVPVLNDKQQGIGKPSIYVVELLAGSAKKLGITTGSRINSKLLGSF